MKLNELENLVINWAIEIGLDYPELSNTQYLKFLEEVGETARAILKQNEAGIIDGFGDIAVTMIVLNLQIKSIESFDTYEYYTNQYNFGDLVRRFQPDFINPMAMHILQSLCNQQGYNLEACLESAYNEIKNRQGKIINGTFVKQ